MIMSPVGGQLAGAGRGEDGPTESLDSTLGRHDMSRRGVLLRVSRIDHLSHCCLYLLVLRNYNSCVIEDALGYVNHARAMSISLQLSQTRSHEVIMQPLVDF